VTTPGILRVFAEAHRRWGSKPWAELFAPAIATATEGWLVRPHVATMFALDEAGYGRLPYRGETGFHRGRPEALPPTGRHAEARGRLSVRNPDLAATLTTLAREGAEDFYTGSIARRIIADMEPMAGCSPPPTSRAWRRRSGRR
jgi:gamma-glutamyltranspeptidase/glutathione hydrolase